MTQIRDRISDGVSRTRLGIELRRAARPGAIVLLGVLAGIGLATYLVLQVSRTALSSTQQLRFAVDDATGVVAGANQVRFKGIPAGTITGVSFAGERPVLTVELQRSFGPVHRDVRAQLRPNTPLQDMFLDIVDPGTARAGEPGRSEIVPASQTTTAVDVSDALDAFRAPVRARLGTLLRELGGGLHDRGAALRNAFAEAVPFLRSAQAITAELGRRAATTRRLVHVSARLTEALGEQDQDIDRLVRDGAAVLRTTAAGAADLRATIGELPPTLQAVDVTLAAVRGVLGDADGAIRALGPVAARLPSALEEVRRLDAAAAPAVRALGRPVRRLVPLAQGLSPLATRLDAATSALRPEVPSLDKLVGNLARCKRGVQGFFQWNASMNKYGDVRGRSPRGNLVVGAQTSSLLNDPNEFAPRACVPGGPIGGRPARPEDGH